MTSNIAIHLSRHQKTIYFSEHFLRPGDGERSKDRLASDSQMITSSVGGASARLPFDLGLRKVNGKQLASWPWLLFLLNAKVLRMLSFWAQLMTSKLTLAALPLTSSKTLCLAVVSVLLLILQGCPMSRNIVSEAKQVRQSIKDANIDISGLVVKYIPVGTPKTAAVDFLQKNMFVLNNQPIAPDKSQTLIAVFAEKSLLASFGFHDEIRVILVFENGVVKRAGGKLIYRSL